MASSAPPPAGSAASPRFRAQTELEAALSLMDLQRPGEARERLLALSPALVFALGPKGRFEYHRALGNCHGTLGDLDHAFAEFLTAIVAAEEVGDYVQRPLECWESIFRHGEQAADWTFVHRCASKALAIARVRRNADLERLAEGARAKAAAQAPSPGKPPT
jgi:hypothetical protein